MQKPLQKIVAVSAVNNFVAQYYKGKGFHTNEKLELRDALIRHRLCSYTFSACVNRTSDNVKYIKLPFRLILVSLF
jgi:hypothetical protein